MSDMDEMSASEKRKEDWMNAKWRPMMGWMYMLVCTMDFVIFPILWSLLQSLSHGQVTAQWQPLTLQGAGLFHMAMGAVLGVAAFGRTQEKLAGVSNAGTSLPTTTTGFGVSSSAPAASSGFGGFGSTSPVSPSPSSFGSVPSPTPSFGSSFGSQTVTTSQTITTTASGKKIVPIEDEPEL